MSSEDGKLNLNPVFKEQLGLLQAAAKSEYDIQISLDKMVHDKNYRETVLNELSELNNATLNKYIHILQRSDVFINTTKQAFSLESLPSLGEDTPHIKENASENKKAQGSENIDEKPFSFFALIAFCFAFLLIFIAWQQGYLQLPINQQVPMNVQTEIAPSKQTEIPLKHEPIKASLDTKVTKASPFAANNESINTEEVTLTPPPLSLPSEKKQLALRLHGSNTVGESLAPALLEAYLKTQGVKEMLWIQGDKRVERELQYIHNNQVNSIQLHAHGSSTGFKDLFNGKADMAMSSRKIKEKERVALRPNNGDLGQASQEYIIGLDGLAIIINPNNPLNSLTNDLLAKVFSGEISNWSEMGGVDQAITIYARDQNSGTWDTFNNLVLKSHKKSLAKTAHRLESSTELSDKVASDPYAIGFIGLPYVKNSKALSIAESKNSIATYPTHFTVSTEDYPLARRLYLYTPVQSNEIAKQFSNFVVSHKGQEIVEKEGLVSQNIKLEKIFPLKNAPSIYNNYTDIAQRLSVNFRFQSNSNELDNKGKRDLPRLVDFMQKNRGRRIALMGFSDSLGDPIKNNKLSFSRAKVIEKELLARGVDVVAVEAFGEQMPIASNRDVLGRSKNRRVEVWFF